LSLTADGCRRGLLVSVEGLSGVGKTYLTAILLDQLPATYRPLLIQEFSQRPDTSGPDLGRDLLRALIDAADGDHFLRGGHPATETLLLLAIKMHDYEAHALPAVQRGQLVLEGRSIHSTAVYQSLITNPVDDEAAYRHAQAILTLAQRWRPLPDLTILLTDDVPTALERAERRDATTYSNEQRLLHHRAAVLFQRLADGDPKRIPVVDRRLLGPDEAVARMAELITNASSGLRPGTGRGRRWSRGSMPTRLPTEAQPGMSCGQPAAATNGRSR
jgi:dTMP kinase